MSPRTVEKCSWRPRLPNGIILRSINLAQRQIFQRDSQNNRGYSSIIHAFSLIISLDECHQDKYCEGGGIMMIFIKWRGGGGISEKFDEYSLTIITIGYECNLNSTTKALRVYLRAYPRTAWNYTRLPHLQRLSRIWRFFFRRGRDQRWSLSLSMCVFYEIIKNEWFGKKLR